MNDCILWRGGKGSDGYGLTKVNGKTVRAHRDAYIKYRGHIPDGMYVLHKCDVPLCVNPDHLFLGTHQDNSDDMVSKNRQSRLKGEDHGRSILKEKDIPHIKCLIEEGRYTYDEIAAIFNCSKSTISDIKNRRSWRHL